MASVSIRWPLALCVASVLAASGCGDEDSSELATAEAGDGGVADGADGADGAADGDGEDGSDDGTPSPTPDAPPLDELRAYITPPDDPILTIDGFHEHLLEHGITDVQDAIAALPSSMRRALFLMKDTRSRHQASAEYPRIVLFGSNARFLFSVSTLPTDPLRETIELAELLPHGQWKFRQITLQPGSEPELDESDATCKGCHTPDIRPIWDDYNHWESVLNDRENNAAYTDLVADLRARIPDRFGDLIAEDGDWSGESFNFYLGESMMQAFAVRMRNNETYTPESRYAYLAAHCSDEGRSESIAAILEAWGISQYAVRTKYLTGEFGTEEVQSDSYDTFYGGGYYYEHIADVVTADLLFWDQDPEIWARVAPVLEAYPYATQANYNLDAGMSFFDNRRTGYLGSYGLSLWSIYDGVWGLYPSFEEDPGFSGRDSAARADFCAYVQARHAGG